MGLFVIGLLVAGLGWLVICARERKIVPFDARQIHPKRSPPGGYILYLGCILAFLGVLDILVAGFLYRGFSVVPAIILTLLAIVLFALLDAFLQDRIRKDLERKEKK